MADGSEGRVEFLSSHSELESDGESVTVSRIRRPRANGTSKTERVPLIRSSSSESSSNRNEFDDPEFASLVREIESAIDQGIVPERIYQGTSGSYFAKNRKRKTVGVFKPKDEEPYGHLNPKWIKWLHKLFLPCCFGRSCIVPNQGYLSEAGASLVDEKLQLNVVPKTKVVYLAAETFHYRFADRMTIRLRRYATEQWPGGIGQIISRDLPLKVGSLQTFVKDCKSAGEQLEAFAAHPLPPHMEKKLQLQFERLVVLDYIIRNTDRGKDNWLIHYKKLDEEEESEKTGELQTLSLADEREEKIQIAAIDNGLAFPFKHPDEWRAYPFLWAELPMAKVPFSSEISCVLLEKLKDDVWMQDLVHDLGNLFKRDKGFDNRTFEKQMSVLRGQVLNLTRALEKQLSPWDLANMHPNIVETVKLGRTHRFMQKFRNQSPFFKDC